MWDVMCNVSRKSISKSLHGTNILTAWSVNVRVVQWIKKAKMVMATARLTYVKVKTSRTRRLCQKAVVMLTE